MTNVVKKPHVPTCDCDECLASTKSRLYVSGQVTYPFSVAFDDVHLSPSAIAEKVQEAIWWSFHQMICEDDRIDALVDIDCEPALRDIAVSRIEIVPRKQP